MCTYLVDGGLLECDAAWTFGWLPMFRKPKTWMNFVPPPEDHHRHPYRREKHIARTYLVPPCRPSGRAPA